PYGPPPRFRALLRDPYDGEIAYADDAVGKFFGYLKEHALYDPTLIIVASDHGESFGKNILDKSAAKVYSCCMSDTKRTEPKTLQEAIVYFSNPDNCLDYVVARRWPNGVVCPTCGRTDARFLANQLKWQCKSVHHHRQFSVKIGTIFEDSPLGLDKWLMAMWMITNCKNGVSSYEIARDLK